jgi:hypothetical protein
MRCFEIKTRVATIGAGIGIGIAIGDRTQDSIPMPIPMTSIGTTWAPRAGGAEAQSDGRSLLCPNPHTNSCVIGCAPGA